MKDIECSIFYELNCEYLPAVIKDNKGYVIDGNEMFAINEFLYFVCPTYIEFYVGDYDCLREKGENYKIGLLDSETGNVFIEAEYDEVGGIYSNYISVKKDGKYGFVDSKGKEVIECKWEKSYITFDGGLCAVSDGVKWGYINLKGNIVIPIIFDEANFFERYYHETSKVYKYRAKVKFENKYGYIDIDGKYTIKPRYSEIKTIWKDRYYPAEENGKWGIIDIYGNEVVNFIFDALGKYVFIDFKNEKRGLSIYCVKSFGLWGIVTENFEIIYPIQGQKHILLDNIKIYPKTGYINKIK